MPPPIRCASIQRLRVYHTLRWPYALLLSALLVYLPIGIAALVIADKQPSCSLPMLVFIRYGGVLTVVFALSNAFDAFVAIRGRALIYTLNASQAVVRPPARIVDAAKSWAAAWRAPIMAFNALRELCKLGVVAFFILGVIALHRCTERRPHNSHDVQITSAVLAGVLAFALAAWGLVELVSATRIGAHWHTDIALPAVAQAFDAIKAAPPRKTMLPDRAKSLAFTPSAPSGVAHSMIGGPLPGIRFCNVCTFRIVAGSVQECSCCAVVAHHHCAAMLPADCKAPVARSAAAAAAHHWIRGNCPSQHLPASCVVCFNSTASVSALVHWRCAWCHATAHADDIASAPAECTRGPLRSLIVAPDCVTLERDGSHTFLDNADPSVSPLLVLVNPKAGGRQGERLMPLFKQLLNPLQVFDLSQGGPAPGLKAFRRLRAFRVVCAGGDGTAGWVLQVIDGLRLRCVPPVAVIPLGTGNDLARSLGWGPGYEGESVLGVLQALAAGQPMRMDRWTVTVAPPAAAAAAAPVVKVINNYFSIGLDAALALRFHTAREAAPLKFNSRLYNKYYYGRVGAEAMLCGSCGARSLEAAGVSLLVDGEAVSLARFQGLMVLNVPSYAAGCDLWGRPANGWQRTAIDDGLLEVVGVRSIFHLGRVTSKKRAVGTPLRIGQGRRVELRVAEGEAQAAEMAVQVDGEPWAQALSGVVIEWKNQAFMLTDPLRRIATGAAVSATAPSTPGGGASSSSGEGGGGDAAAAAAAAAAGAECESAGAGEGEGDYTYSSVTWSEEADGARV